jgi:hypothetical protein
MPLLFEGRGASGRPASPAHRRRGDRGAAQGAPLPVQLPPDARQSPALPGPSFATAAPQAKKIRSLLSLRLLFWLNI